MTLDERERLRRLRAYGFDAQAASSGGRARHVPPIVREDADGQEPAADLPEASRTCEEADPADPLRDPYARFTRLWMAWILGDPEIRTNWRRAGPAALILAAWNVPAWLVLLAGAWVKDTYQVEDPLGVAGAILVAILFALVWFGGARLTLRWWRRRRG